MSSKAKKEWRQNTLEPLLKCSAERQDSFATTSEIEPLYCPEEGVADYPQSLGYPGEHL